MILKKFGHQPRILLWNCETGIMVKALYGHKYGVQTLEFSSDGCLLASLGVHHDGFLYIWDISSGNRLASVKMPSNVPLIDLDHVISF